MLGDYYREKGQIEEAFCAYMRVDAMYNADAVEHAKAIYNLSELFKEKKFGDRTWSVVSCAPEVPFTKVVFFCFFE